MAMKNKVTFFVLSSSGAPVRQASASKTMIMLLGIFIFLAAGVCISVSGYGIYNYDRLQALVKDNKSLKSKNLVLSKEVGVRNKQVRIFAEKINELKSEVLALNNFEKRIRVFANLEQDEEGSGLFGIGGSIPEDLNTKIQLEKEHNLLIREMHDQVDQLGLLITYQQDGFEGLIEDIEKQRNLLASTPSISPAKGYYSSRFGYRRSPFTGYREFHKGLDIACRRGTPIVAPADGVISFAGKKGMLGNLIVIDHGHGMVTRFGHCQKLAKKRGESIKRGDVVAYVGNTGRSTGPHVHYEVHLNGIPVNPEYYILN